MEKLPLIQRFDFVNSAQVIQRFNFIKDNTIKSKLIDSFKYLVFLTILEEEYDVATTAGRLIYKDIIVHSASILECLIHYKIKSMVDSFEINFEDLGLVEEKLSNKKVLYVIDSETNLVSMQVKKTKRDLDFDEDFHSLNSCAKNIKIFNEDNFNRADKIRKLRNKIHVFSLGSSSINFSKELVEEVFDDLDNLLKVLT